MYLNSELKMYQWQPAGPPIFQTFPSQCSSAKSCHWCFYSNIAETDMSIIFKTQCHFSSVWNSYIYVNGCVCTLSQVRDAPFTEDLNELGLISSHFFFACMIEGLWRKQKTCRFSHLIIHNIIFDTGELVLACCLRCLILEIKKSKL